MCSAHQILSVCLSDIISGAEFSEAPKYSTLSCNSFCTIGATDMNQSEPISTPEYHRIAF